MRILFGSKLRCESLLVVAAIAIISIPACGKNDVRVKVYPVQGKILVKGAPAEGARVVFYPVADELKKPGMPVPEGTTDAQGVYKLKSFKADDGAPEGTFKVSVLWREPIPAGADPETVSPKDRLDGRYADPQKSQLTAKVERGGGEVPPFELQ